MRNPHCRITQPCTGTTSNLYLRLLLPRLPRHRRYSIHPLPTQPCLNRVTNLSHPQHQAPFREMRLYPPANEGPPRTAARSHERTSVAETRSVFHHRGRSTPVSYRCGSYGRSYYGCWHTYPGVFPCQYYSTYCDPYDYYRLYPLVSLLTSSTVEPRRIAAPSGI